MYERFQMKPNEKIRDFFSRFMNILYKLEALGKTYPPGQQVRKVLRSMTEKWDIMVYMLYKNLETREMTLYELKGKLEAHEISYFDGKEKGDDRKRVAIKVSKPSSDSEGYEGGLSKSLF
ncbi:hypothetical protein L6164_001339 [Bauhinia variegata]|nr:hypothetical protein L6164_001339 [Bauhinia variegata]